MSTHQAGRTPGGYPVVEVERGVDAAADWPEHPTQTKFSLRSLRLSGWEIALWVIAVVLVVAAVQINAYATQQLYFGTGYSSNCDSDGVCSPPTSMVYLQSAVSLSPAGLAAGLFSAIVAIALRAMNSAALRRSDAAASIAANTASGSVSAPAPASAPASSTAAVSAFASPSTPAGPPVAPASPPVAGYRAATRVHPSTFARPSATPTAEPDVSLFQRPRDE